MKTYPILNLILLIIAACVYRYYLDLNHADQKKKIASGRNFNDTEVSSKLENLQQEIIAILETKYEQDSLVEFLINFGNLATVFAKYEKIVTSDLKFGAENVKMMLKEPVAFKNEFKQLANELNCTRKKLPEALVTIYRLKESDIYTLRHYYTLILMHYHQKYYYKSDSIAIYELLPEYYDLAESVIAEDFDNFTDINW